MSAIAAEELLGGAEEGFAKSLDSEGGEGFAEPLGFLNDFVEEGVPYEGLYGHLASELDLDREADVRDYASALALDIPDQENICRLLGKMIEQRHGKRDVAVHKKFHPEIDAGINFLKYRLVTGIMEPAVAIALDRTEPEHTRVRIQRTIVAVNMVREWVNATLGNVEKTPKLSGFLDREIEGHVRQFFVGEYDRVSPEIVDKFLEIGVPLPFVSSESDDYRLFDLKDFSQRAQYAVGHGRAGIKLPTTEEYDAIIAQEELDRITAAKTAAQSGIKPRVIDSRPRLTVGEQRLIARQTLIFALDGLGVLSRNDAKPIPAEERVLPSGKLEGLAVARTTAKVILDKIGTGCEVSVRNANGRARKLSEETVAEITRRLESILGRSDLKITPIDSFLKAAEEAYIAEYGETTTRRDFWD